MFGAKRINLKSAEKLIKEKDAVLIDVRDPVSYRNNSIPSSINLPLRRIGEIVKYPKTTNLIVFGGDDNTTVQIAVNYITGFGFTKIYFLESADNS